MICCCLFLNAIIQKCSELKLEFEVDLPSFATVVCLDLMIPSALTVIVANNWLQRPSFAISGWEYKFDRAEWSMKWRISNSNPTLFFFKINWRVEAKVSLIVAKVSLCLIFVLLVFLSRIGTFSSKACNHLRRVQSPPLAVAPCPQCMNVKPWRMS